jgi:hypothetical protein
VAPTTKRRLPWAGRGTAFEGGTSAMDAATKSGAAAIHIGTRQAAYVDDDGQFVLTDKDRYIIASHMVDGARKKAELGRVTEGYTLLQNVDIARALDESRLTERWPVVQMATPGVGGLLIVLDLGQDEIYKEAYQRFALLEENRNGSTGLRFRTLAYRLVCTNGMTVVENGKDLVRLVHNQQMGDEFQFTVDVAPSLENNLLAQKQALEALAEIPLPEGDAGELFGFVYAPPRKGRLLRQYEEQHAILDAVRRERAVKMGEEHERACRIASALREVCKERHALLCQEFPIHQGTALGAYQAVAEVADHSRVSREGSMTSIDGFRADEKLRAYHWLTTKLN